MLTCLGLFFMGCRKNYTCECEDIDGNSNSTNFENMTKKGAKAVCNERTDTYEYCHLK
ncbi:MAG: hypothetical protein IT222_02220 [Crocinitomix sp.]|nr:hypothetical protein [Crocinitomix sp.]